MRILGTSVPCVSLLRQITNKGNETMTFANFTRFSAVSTIAVLMAAPAAAQYVDGQYTVESRAAYEDCKSSDTQNQILGAVVGGVVGGVVGNEIEEGEGTAIGAAGGAYAGTQIADKDCEDHLRRDHDARTDLRARTAIGTQRRTFYDANDQRVITDEYGRVISVSPRTDVAGAVAYDVSTRYEYVDESRYDNRTMVRLRDTATGNLFFVNRADYDRYYR